MTFRACIVLCVALLGLAGCSKELIAYSPQVDRFDDPQRAFEEAINTGMYPPLKIETTTTYTKATWAGAVIITQTVMFEDIARIQLFKVRDRFLVIASDTDGKRLITYQSRKVAQAKQLIDSLEALRRGRSAKPEREPGGGVASPGEQGSPLSAKRDRRRAAVSAAM